MPSHFRAAFDLMDYTESGFLDAGAVERALIDAGTAPPSKEILAALIAAADLDGDGNLTFEELHQMLKQVLTSTLCQNNIFSKRTCSPVTRDRDHQSPPYPRDTFFASSFHPFAACLSF